MRNNKYMVIYCLGVGIRVLSPTCTIQCIHCIHICIMYVQCIHHILYYIIYKQCIYCVYSVYSRDMYQQNKQIPMDV